MKSNRISKNGIWFVALIQINLFKMKRILLATCLVCCGLFLKAQSVSLPEMNFNIAPYFDHWTLGSETFFVAPVFLDSYIDFNEFHLNVRYNHNTIEPLTSDLSQINDDNYIANYSNIADYSMVSGGSITAVVNIVSGTQSLLTISFSGATTPQALYSSCNGNLMYLAFKKIDPCFKGPIELQFWNGDDSGTFVNPTQTHACQIIGLTNTYSTETGNLLSINGEVLFNTPQVNIIPNGNILEAYVIGGTQPMNYEWSDKIGNILGSSDTYSPTDTGMIILTVIDAEGCFTLSSYNFYFNISNINTHLKETTIYPNPTTGVFYIRGGAFDRVKVFNTLGDICYEGSESKIDFSKHKKGVYFIHKTTSEHTKVEQLILN